MKRLLCVALAWVLGSLALARPSSAASTDLMQARFGDQYPIVMFAVPATDQAFERVKAIGAEYVHVYGLSRSVTEEGLAKMKHYLDLAQKHGLKVMFDLDGSRRCKRGEQGLKEMRRIVDRFKDHPALGFWYLCDEPNIRLRIPPATLQQFYDMIKKESPDVPVCVATTTGKDWDKYQNTYDILSYDTYPVHDRPFPSDISRVTDFNARAVARGKPVFPILQMFNWQFMQMQREIRSGKYDPAKTPAKLKHNRYPDLRELRYWNFATLVQGAQGVMYYSYLRGIQDQLDVAYREKAGPDWNKGLTINPKWVDTTLKSAIGELRSFTRAARPARRHETIQSQGQKNLLMGVWRRENKSYVVLVNASQEQRDVTLDDRMTAPFKQGKATAWGFSRNVQPHAGANGQAAIEQMRPWEVLVWEISPETR